MASNYLISGAWGSAVLVCGHHHEETPEMEIEHSSHTLTYVCPKRSLCNREDGEPRCNNNISIYDFEKALDHISKMLVEAENNDEILFLRNHKWKYKAMEFEVLEHNGDKLVIKLVNSTTK